MFIPFNLNHLFESHSSLNNVDPDENFFTENCHKNCNSDYYLESTFKLRSQNCVDNTYLSLIHLNLRSFQKNYSNFEN